MAGTLVISGFKETIAAIDTLVPSERAAMRGALEKVGELVRVGGARTLIQYKTGGVARSEAEVKWAEHSAAGFKTRVRQRGIEVEQSLRKTTGLHPEWGGVQMRHGLLPALFGSEPAIIAEFDRAMDKVVIAFNR